MRWIVPRENHTVIRVKIVYTVKKAVSRGQEQDFYQVYILQTQNLSLFVSLLPVAEATLQYTCIYLVNIFAMFVNHEYNELFPRPCLTELSL